MTERTHSSERGFRDGGTPEGQLSSSLGMALIRGMEAGVTGTVWGAVIQGAVGQNPKSMRRT